MSSVLIYQVAEDLSKHIKNVDDTKGQHMSTIRCFQKRNFTQSTKCSSLNLTLTVPSVQANFFGQNPADGQHWPVDNSTK
jgi:hypothetical protein